MKIKDTLDLCGWELWNFCIQNHQNLEGLLDLGAGRKVFYTGNDQGKNGREVIYDGSKWKVSAYMSDVDELRGLITALENATDEEIEALKGRATTLEGRATTTEGNLATLRSEFDALNKALNEDTAGTIDTWNEIQNFVGKYDGSEDLETILSRMNAEIDSKLDLKGGVMTFGSVDSLIIRKTTNNLSLIRFDGFINSANTPMGYLGFYGVNNPVFFDTTTKPFALLHAGNFDDLIGDTYLKTTGGTITGRLTIQGDGTAWLHFQSSTQNFGSIGVNETGPKFWDGASGFTILHEGNYSDLITTLNNNLNVPSITIGGIKLSVENGLLKIEGSAFATGELAAGGAATEGNGGAGGFSLYESWGTSAPTEPLALGANLGYELKTRVEDLELAKTKVTFEPALVSGKQIGTITIDGNKTNLFAPATYAWSEITSKPTTLAGYGITDALPLSGGTLTGTLTLSKEGSDIFVINRLNSSSATTITYRKDNSLLGRMGFDASTKEPVAQVSGTYQTLLHSGNYSSYALPLSGGTIGDGKAEIPLSVNGISTNVAIALQANGTAKGYLNWNNTWGTCLIDGGNTNYRLGIKADGTPYYSNAASATHTLLHSGNIGEHALKTDGSNEMSGAIKFTGKTLAADASAKDSGIRMYSFSEVEAAPSNSIYHSTFSAISSYVGFQLSVYGGAGTNDLYYRKLDGEGNWSDWKTIAFTDSTVENSKYIATLYSDGSNWYTNKYRLFGQWDNYNGQTLELKTEGDLSVMVDKAKGLVSKAQTYAVVVNDSGNVNIGDQDYAGTGYRLWVNGATNVEGNLRMAGELIFAGGYSIQSYNNTALSINPQGNNILLSPNGYGHVGIGTTNPTYKLDVNGKIFAREQIYSDVGFILRTNDGKGARASFSHSSNTLYIQSGYNDGSNVSGYMMLCGVNTNHMASLEVRALKSAFDGRLIVGSTNDDGTSYLQVNGTSTFGGQSTFNALALFNEKIVAKNTLQIGDANIWWDEEKKALFVDKSLASMGEISAGGAGTEGGNTGGGGGTGTITNPYVVNFTPSQETSHSFYHNLPYYDVVVQVYEKNAISGAWDMILADVTIANESNLVTVNFGRKEDVEHKIVVR